MKTFFIDLDNLASDNFKQVIGFVLTVGLNFRKIDLIKEKVSSRVLVVECESKAEEKAFKSFLDKHSVVDVVIVDNSNKAVLGTKKVGSLKQVGSREVSNFYLDKTSGRKFIIEK